LAHFTTTIDTQTSRDIAFEYLADFANVAKWDPFVSQARRLTRGPIGPGTRYEIRMPIAGSEIRLEYTIVEYDTPRRIVLEADGSWLRSRDTIELDESELGCHIRYDADLRPRGIAYLLDLPMHLAFQITGARSARGLKGSLERLTLRTPTGKKKSASNA